MPPPIPYQPTSVDVMNNVTPPQPSQDDDQATSPSQQNTYNVVRTEMTNDQFLRHERKADERESQRATNDERREYENKARELEKGLIKQTSQCDGATTQGVRIWLDEIELILPLVRGRGARDESLM